MHGLVSFPDMERELDENVVQWCLINVPAILGRFHYISLENYYLSFFLVYMSTTLTLLSSRVLILDLRKNDLLLDGNR